MWVLALGGIMCHAAPNGLGSDSSGNVYRLIAERNVFGLSGPRRPIVDPIDQPLPKLTLTGIAAFAGRKVAILKVQMPARPGEPLKEQSFMLAEGQRVGDIEVLEIDERAGLVKLINFSRAVVLGFDREDASR